MPILATFDDEELNRLYTEVAQTSVNFDTGIVGNSKGVQQRTINRYDAIRTYDIQFGGMTQAAKRALEEFFITKAGRGIGFRFYPPSDRDFQFDVIGVGNGAQTVFYLRRNYYSRGRFITRRILKPIHPLLTVLVDGSKVRISDPDAGEITPAGAFPIINNPITVNWDTGMITFTTAPANGLIITVAEGQYDVPVYFDTDSLNASDYGVFADAESVRLVEILPSALNAAGNDLPGASLAFITPLSSAKVPSLFDVTFAATNLTSVLLYVNGAYYGVSSPAPFLFNNVPRPVIDGISFEVKALGVNNVGQAVLAKITLLSLLVISEVVTHLTVPVTYLGEVVTVTLPV